MNHSDPTHIGPDPNQSETMPSQSEPNVIALRKERAKVMATHRGAVPYLVRLARGEGVTATDAHPTTTILQTLAYSVLLSLAQQDGYRGDVAEQATRLKPIVYAGARTGTMPAIIERRRLASEATKIKVSWKFDLLLVGAIVFLTLVVLATLAYGLEPAGIAP